MDTEFFQYYAPELMIVLFLASLFLGLVTGYYLWGSFRARVQRIDEENSRRQDEVNRLAKTVSRLKSQLELVD